MIDWNSSGRLFHSLWPLKVNARWPAAVLQSGICRRSLFLVLQLCTSDLVLNFWQRYGGANLINDHPKCEDLVVAYKKLLPRDPFQEEVLIHPLFDIEFVAFKFQVHYCVVPCCQWMFIVYSEWRGTVIQLTKTTHHYVSSSRSQEVGQL